MTQLNLIQYYKDIQGIANNLNAGDPTTPASRKDVADALFKIVHALVAIETHLKS